MVFNSIAFALFLPLIFLLYWSSRIRTPAQRNILIVLSGFFFYGWWDIRFLGLMILTAMTDYFVSRAMERTNVQRKRKRLLFLSLFTNLGALGFFKYFNFFAGSVRELALFFGFHADYATLNIILPVGISFYTFQALSYTIDVYYRRIEAAPDALTYMSYISFFPQLVAGPVERAKHLLPQFGKLAKFSAPMAISGLRLMLWGYFKKSIIADNLSPVADAVFSAKSHPGAAAVIAGTIAFSIQIYGDFSGYSDIARGCARLFGFELVQNFRFPYFAGTMREYWRRWHISMSGWFRDYVYFGLGGNRRGYWRGNLNMILTFLVSGLWHGANWTFVAWGGWHGIAGVIENSWMKYIRIRFPKVLRHLLVIIVTWSSYIYFRSPSFAVAHERFRSLIGHGWNFRELPSLLPAQWPSSVYAVCISILCLLFFGAEFLLSRNKAGLFLRMPTAIRWSVYGVFFILIMLFGVFQQPPTFIYFQF